MHEGCSCRPHRLKRIISTGVDSAAYNHAGPTIGTLARPSLDNKLVLCAWLSGGASEIWSLQ